MLNSMAPFKNEGKNRLIILYGPPGSGKGTQAALLEKLDYEIISSGHSIREFISAQHEDLEDKYLAEKLEKQLAEGELVAFADLQRIIEKRINAVLESSPVALMEGLPREKIQADWLISIAEKNDLDLILVHLVISMEKVVERIQHRFYVKGFDKPYKSYEEAKLAGNGAEPMQRKDDQSIEIITKRYKNQYADSHDEIISSFTNSKAEVITINADVPVDFLHSEILKIVRG